MLELTEQHRANLKQLADYLIALPSSYASFGMSMFICDPEDVDNDRHAEIIYKQNKTIHECGAVACAIGHTKDAGLPLSWCEKNETVSWHKTTAVNYGIDVSNGLEHKDAFNWMFGGDWSDIDNTPQGAAKRIYWVLEHGVPVDWEEQMHGNTSELCYK